jgi:hypothetical protein
LARCSLPIVEGIGDLPLRREEAHPRLPVIAPRCEKGATMMTANRGFGARDRALAGALRVPPAATLAPRPPCAPKADPTERVRLSLRERFLSPRLIGGCNAIACACCIASHAIADAADRIRSLCLPTSSKKVIGQTGWYQPFFRQRWPSTSAI